MTENEGMLYRDISVERVILVERREGRMWGKGKLELMEDVSEC